MPQVDAPGVCETSCGLILQHGTDMGSPACDAFQEAETRALRVILPHAPNACQKWHGVSVILVETPDGYWVDQWGRTVGGVAWCQYRALQVADEGNNWKATALTHELIHMTECPWENVGHQGWNVWQYKAINEADR